MLNSNEMVDACNGNTFKYADFEDMLTNYSVYLKGELKDYMLIYMEDSDYSNFISFFDYFQGHRNFNYKFFEEKHLEYIKYLRELGRKIPPFMETASEALQLYMIRISFVIKYMKLCQMASGRIKCFGHIRNVIMQTCSLK